MKIKWLLDVCLSPGQELTPLGSAAGSLDKKTTLHTNCLCFLGHPPITSHREESRALLVLPLPMNPLSFPLLLLPLLR